MTVTFTRRYRNQESTPVAAVYVFPLDEGAAVCGFAAVVDRILAMEFGLASRETSWVAVQKREIPVTEQGPSGECPSRSRVDGEGILQRERMELLAAKATRWLAGVKAVPAGGRSWMQLAVGLSI